VNVCIEDLSCLFSLPSSAFFEKERRREIELHMLLQGSEKYLEYTRTRRLQVKPVDVRYPSLSPLSFKSLRP
jgi:hypothetical protein